MFFKKRIFINAEVFYVMMAVRRLCSAAAFKNSFGKKLPVTTSCVLKKSLQAKKVFDEWPAHQQHLYAAHCTMHCKLHCDCIAIEKWQELFARKNKRQKKYC